MLTLECYWFDKHHTITARQRSTYTADCVGVLIKQAFLEKMAHIDWVGYIITDAEGDMVHMDFTKDAQVKTVYATVGK